MQIQLQTETTGLGTGSTSVHDDLVDHLVAEHFEHVFSMISTFVEDAEQSLNLTHGLFQALSEESSVSTLGLYREVARLVRGLEGWSGFLETAARDSVLCWLLKETTPLNYAMIGQVMNLESEEVKHGIASVRNILIGLV